MENIDFNWLAQTPSTVVPIESYTPDYSFLQSMQMKIGQQYQQGVSQVRGAYANIFNRPVTGEAANKTLQEYKRQAQEQLQSITGYNFADQKNVQLAEDVFKPFTEDKALLYNIAGTQTYNDNTQKIQSGLQSTDEKTRDMYNSIQLQDQEGYKKELAEAGLDRDKQSRIQQRSVTPFYDIPTELKNAAGKEGTDNEWDVLDGAGHIIKQKGGAQSLGNYSTFARSALSNPKYQGMFETMARVRRDQLIDQVKATDKTVTPDNVNQKVADYVIDENNKVYDKVITDYNGDISKLTNELNLIKGRIKTKNVNGEHAPTDAAYDTFMQYQTTINKLNGELLSKTQEKAKFQRDIVDKRDYFINNPIGMLSNLVREPIIDNYAMEQASIHNSREIKSDEAWQWANTNRHWQNDYNFKVGELAQNTRNEQDKLKLGYYKEGAIYDPFTRTLTKRTDIPLTDAALKNHVDIKSGTVTPDMTGFTAQDAAPASTYKKGIQDNIRNSISTLWNLNGYAGGYLLGEKDTVIGVPKLFPNDINIVREALTAKTLDNKYQYTKDEQEVLNRVAGVMGVSKTHNPNSNTDEYEAGTFQHGLENYIAKKQKVVKEMPNAEAISLSNDFENAKNDLHEGQAKAELLQILIDKKITENPDVYHKLLNDNGNFATDNDLEDQIKKELNSVVLKDGSKLTAKDLVEAYNTSNYNLDPSWGMGAIIVGGKKLKETDIDHIEWGNQHSPLYAMPHAREFADLYNNKIKEVLHGLEHRYGKPEEHSILRHSLENEVVKDIPGWDQISADMGKRQSFNKADPKQEGTVKALSLAMAEPANIDPNNITMDGKPVTDNNVIKALQNNILGNPDYIQAMNFKGYDKTGKPYFDVVIDDTKAGAKEMVGGVPLKDLIGKSITVGVSETPSDDNLKTLLVTRGIGAYNYIRAAATRDVYEKQGTGGNATQEANGFKVKLYTTNYIKNIAQGYLYAGTYDVMDKDTGKMKTVNASDGKVVNGSFDNRTPQQALQELNETYNKVMTNNINAYNYYRNNVNSHAPSFDKIEADFKNGLQK